MRNIPAIAHALSLAALASALAGCGPSASQPSSAPKASASAEKPAPPLSDAPVLAAVKDGKANAAWRVPIQGMSCDGCADGIRSELLRMPGVAAAAVGFKESLAVVAVDTNKLTFEGLAKVVADAGYKALPLQP